MQTRSPYLIHSDMLGDNGFAKTCHCYVTRTWSDFYHLPSSISSGVFRVYQNCYLLRTSVVTLFFHVHLEYRVYIYICCSSGFFVLAVLSVHVHILLP